MTESRAWVRDPLIWLGALFAAGAHAWVFFAGEYLPYIDYASHVGLISILAHGDETGALQYFSRSWAPNPYSLFYFVSALLAQALPVVVAAKLALVVASGSLTLAAAELAEVHGRDARLGLIAPMATFGYALGYGFASFVFAMPTMLFALAALERLLRRLLADRLDLQGIVYAVLALFVFLLLLSWRRRNSALHLSYGYPAVLLGFLALYALGPDAINKPFSVWLFYSRFATLTALAIFLLPRVRLSGLVGVLVGVLELSVLAYDASQQRVHVVNFNQVARQYDAVRAAVPPRKRILALTYGTAAGDPMVGHPNLRTLYFYHLADGAAYVAYLFDNPLIPVRYRHDVAAPEAPFWRTPYTFDPKVHGREFDLLILRGAPVDRAKKSKDHRLLREVNGWSIFETLEPPPWPSGRGPDAPG